MSAQEQMMSTENRMEFIRVLQMELSNLTFYHSVEKDLSRLIGLVQDHQDFFGDPPAGESCIKLAVDKLEELIKAHKRQ